jgi:hypothetical protein
MAGRLDQETIQGAQYVFDGDFFDTAAAEDPADRHDFTAHDGIFIIRRRRDDDAPELTRATFGDGRMTSPALGELHVEIPASSTETFEAGCYWYWLSTWPTGADDDAFYWLEGTFTVHAGNGA